jgi:hypothetical protein
MPLGMNIKPPVEEASDHPRQDFASSSEEGVDRPALQGCCRWPKGNVYNAPAIKFTSRHLSWGSETEGKAL